MSAVTAEGSPRSKRTVDLNRILQVLNALIAVATVVAYVEVGKSEFIDAESIVLATFLAAQTHIALMIERRRRDPLVVVMVFFLVLYYSLRIFTLLLFPFSVVFGRFNYTAADSNYALAFIVFANCFIYAGLYSVRGPRDPTVQTIEWIPASPFRAAVILAGVVVMIYSRGVLWNPESLPRIVQVVFVFLAQSVILLMAMAYFVVFRREMGRGMRLAFVAILILEAVLHTLAGSRSAFVYALQNLLIVVLAVHGVATIRRRTVVAGLVTLPITLAVLGLAFVVSTAVTAFRASGTSVSISQALDVSSQTASRVDRDYAVQLGLPLIFARAGFFDFSAEIIAHQAQYTSVINVSTYVKSVIDNVLTPGFDVYDQPKIANALHFIYDERGTPSKAASVEGYQSDQVGMYGDLYTLFGYAALQSFSLSHFYSNAHTTAGLIAIHSCSQ